MTIVRLVTATFALLCAMAGHAQESLQTSQPLGIALEDFDYPFEVRYMPLNIDGQEVRMAYMDVGSTSTYMATTSTATSEPVVLLLHGKNFFGAYWENTIRELRHAGFRVIVPDQIGFGKSSKPDIHYSFHLLASNTRELLDRLGVEKAAVLGHSMGGMLATRFALMYPDRTSCLVLENPIGLEDYRTTVPYSPTSDYYWEALRATAESTRKYHQTYYASWKPEYDTWVQAQYLMTLGGEAFRLARVSALTTQMIYEQPVVHQFPEIKVPTLLVIGQHDRTVIGRGKLKPADLAAMGNYPEFGRKTAATIPGAKLVALDNVGHIPHLEAPDRFHQPLIEFLRQNHPVK